MVFSFFKKHNESKPESKSVSASVPAPQKPAEQALPRRPEDASKPPPSPSSSKLAGADAPVSAKPAPVMPRLAVAAQAALGETARPVKRPDLAGGQAKAGATGTTGGAARSAAPTAASGQPAAALPKAPVAKVPAPSVAVQAKPTVATSLPGPSSVPEKVVTRAENLPQGGGSRASKPAADDDFDDDVTHTESFIMNADAEDDPVQADVEQIVIMYADGRDSAARVLLEKLLSAYSPAEGRKLWLLLFDLLQVQGDRAGFDRLCLEFARVCEMSPPSWREEQPRKKAVARAGSIALSGVLTADDTKLLRQIQVDVGKPGELNLDCSRWMGCDDTLAGQLAELLQAARRGGKVVRLSGIEAFMQRLDSRLEVGVPEHEPSWRLLLELLQRYGTQDRFEERAVDYAVSFELSPPSWEQRDDPGASIQDGGGDMLALEDFFPDESEGAHCLSGSLVNHRFEDIQPYLVAHDPAILDFSAVTRVDFFSAGQLVNRLAPLAAQGRQITIRHPNRLVCGLLQIVGLDQYARIVTVKA